MLACVAGIGLGTVASAGLALGSDPPVTLLSPADGAVVATSPDGIAISYRCPRYTSYVDTLTGAAVTRGSGEYVAGVSTSRRARPDGRLAETVQTAGVVPIGDDLEICETAFGGRSSYTEPRPHAVPGRYYWQVWRSCADCPGGFEVGPIRSFTVELGVTLAVRAPKVASAGIAVLVPVRVAGGSGVDLVLQRRQGGR